MGNPYAPPGQQPRPPEQQPGPDAGAGPGPGSAPGGAPPDAPHPGPPPGWPGADGPWPADPSPGQRERPGGPHPAPGHRRPQPAPDSEIARTTSRRVLHFLTLLLAAVVTSGLPLPWQLGALAFLVTAIGVGIRALVHAVRGGIRGGLVIMLGVGVVVAAFVGLAMLSWLVLWPQQVEHQRCLDRAVTISATRQCDVDFERAVEERLDRLGERATTSGD